MKNEVFELLFEMSKNHRKYIGASLKWCIRDCRKVCFWTDYWVYILSLVSFMDENNLHYINGDAKVHDFLNSGHQGMKSPSYFAIHSIDCFSRY